jgi:hypothetical protein
MLIVESGDARPVPNSKRELEMRGYAYITVQGPDALAAGFISRGNSFSIPLIDTQDRPRGFEITDPDGLGVVL